MAKKTKAAADISTERLQALLSQESIFGIPGPGRWLVFDYEPTSLFSLKMSMATSSVGKTLVIPTSYAVKMAILDAAFRIGWPGPLDTLVQDLAKVETRIGVPHRATVTHTIVKIRQEPKDKKAGPPYIPAVAYREFVHFQGLMRWAFDLARLSDVIAAGLTELAPAVHYIGKRGGFIQFRGVSRLADLGQEFTQPLNRNELRVTTGLHIAVLDDFGPDADLESLNSYSDKPIKRGKHRRFEETVIPLGVVNVGPGFTEYAVTNLK